MTSIIKPYHLKIETAVREFVKSPSRESLLKLRSVSRKCEMTCFRNKARCIWSGIDNIFNTVMDTARKNEILEPLINACIRERRLLLAILLPLIECPLNSNSCFWSSKSDENEEISDEYLAKLTIQAIKTLARFELAKFDLEGGENENINK